jgi:hypothetical protein
VAIDDDGGFSIGVEVAPADDEAVGAEHDHDDLAPHAYFAAEAWNLHDLGWANSRIANELHADESEVRAVLLGGRDTDDEGDDFAYTPEEAYGIEPDVE